MLQLIWMVVNMKVIDKSEVANLIKDDDTVVISGSGGSGSPEVLIKSVMDSYLSCGHPRNITVSCGISPGNLTNDDVGMNMLAKPGLVGKAICAHLGMGRVFGNAIGNNQFPAFAVPLGVINHLYRAIAGNEMGVFTHVGLNTFADPRIDGCCANEKAKKLEPMVELLNINNKEILLYKSFPVNVALLKATYADTDGNVSLEHEAVIGEQYNMAIATHNSGGIVIVQVEEIKPKNSFRARDVLLHSSIVDYVVVAKPDLSLGEYNVPIYRPELTGDTRIKLEDIQVRKLDERKVCGRRSAMELSNGYVVNLGVGMPDSVANVAAEEGISEQIYLSVESGPTGGVPIGGVVFGSSINPDSVISTAEQFDAYNGGSLDMAIVGLAQVDKYGNVNVSKFGTRVTGPGGFINITQSTHKVVFIGTFMAGGLEEEVKDGKLNIISEGNTKKFVNCLEQITFSAKNAIKNNQEILFVTERAVFRLIPDGLELIEIAPGIDINRDILNQMEFSPVISKNLKLMDERIFREEKMNLKL
jgi:propionate CoA-transferase